VPKSILIRDVPDEIASWVRSQRQRQVISQREFLLSLLKTAYEEAPGPGITRLGAAESGTASRVTSESPAPWLPFRFIDLFAGIGGMRLGLEAVGGHCVFSCEKDRFAQKTYSEWFGEVPFSDINDLTPGDVPDHDVLTAGFPCQPFSIAGVSKKKSLGHAHGFKCLTQGTLFFSLVTIIEAKRPAVLFLENVKNLRSHEKGTTWNVIRSTLESLNYVVFDDVIDAAGWVPQHRERIMIVCFDRTVFGDAVPFEFPKPPDGPRPCLRDILERRPHPKYTLSDHLWNYLQEYAARHRSRGNGFGFGLTRPDGITRTLSARYYKDGSEILVPQRRKNPRRLTPRECARLMGFPDNRPIVVSDTQAYRQFGNAVVPTCVEAVGRNIVAVLQWHFTHGNGRLLKSQAAA